MTTQANKDLEISTIRGDTLGVEQAFLNGAKVDHKHGWYFITACSYGNLDMVKIFLQQPNFVKIANKLLKSGYGHQLHEGFVFAGANGHLELFKFLHHSPVYQQLTNAPTLVLDRLGDFTKSECVDILCYVFEFFKLHKNSNFIPALEKLPLEKQIHIKKTLLPFQLDDSMIAKNSIIRNKI